MILLVESGSTNTNWRMITSLNEQPKDLYSQGINPYYQTASEIENTQSAIFLQLEAFPIAHIHYYVSGIT